MRAYFVILKDSFREAIASRVLLISLIGLVVVLLALSPFRLKYDQSTSLRRSELTQPSRLLKELTNDQEDKSPVAKHLWSLLSEDEQNSLSEFLPKDSQETSAEQSGRGNRQKRRLVEQLNQILQKDNFYVEEAWKDVRQSEELETLLNSDDLSSKQTQRRNLLLFAAAFRRSIALTDSSAIYLMYGSAEVFGPIPLTPTEFRPFFQEITVAVVAVFLGFFGVFGTLLITAGIIPRTFEPGEITLLASKPIRRSGLFLTKFLGGCIFTLIFAIVLVVGVWLILGFRFEEWNHRLLWCIPIYLFLFMIYYSVSALSGVIWKNAIVSLTVVVLFWLLIVVVGVTYESLRSNLVTERGIKEIVVAGEDLLTVDGQRQTWLWNAESSEWEEVFNPPQNRVNDFIRRFRLAAGIRFVPMYDRETNQILAIQANQSPFGGLGSPELVAGNPENDWDRVSVGRIPSMVTTPLISNQNELLLLSRDRILKYNPPAPGTEDSAPAGGILGGLLGSGSTLFSELQPKDYEERSESFTATLTPEENALITYSEGTLQRLESTEYGYVITKTTTLEDALAATVAASDRFGILCFADGTVSAFDAKTLKITATLQNKSNVIPKRSEVSPDSRFIAVLTHDETVMLFDATKGTRIDWQPPENGSCSAVTFDENGKLLISDGRLAVHQYDIDLRKREKSWAQSETTVHRFFDYVVTPLHNLLPRPGQLDRFAKWTLDGKQDVIAGAEEDPDRASTPNSLLPERDRFEPAGVLWKNGLFIAVLLGLGCIYVSRSDF